MCLFNGIAHCEGFKFQLSGRECKIFACTVHVIGVGSITKVCTVHVIGVGSITKVEVLNIMVVRARSAREILAPPPN